MQNAKSDTTANHVFALIVCADSLANQARVVEEAMKEVGHAN